MIIVIDNYDSFTYTLVQYFGIHTSDIMVFKHDKIDLPDIVELDPSLILISPGPKSPSEAGISKLCIEKLSGTFPIFGVCLGHQAVGEVFGAKVSHAALPVHGKTYGITHDQKGVFKDVEQGFKVARYHSLIVENENFPHDVLEITATTEDGQIMGLRHKYLPVESVQFHPESFLTEDGYKIVKNAITWAYDYKPPVKAAKKSASNINKKDSFSLAEYRNKSKLNSLPTHDLCSSCGICIGQCPQIKEYNEIVRITGSCTKKDGLCMALCPWNNNEHSLFNANFSSGIGSYISAYSCHASDVNVRSRGQNGGSVTALIRYLLSTEKNTAVVGVKFDKLFEAKPCIAMSGEEPDDMHGSTLTAVPTLTKLNSDLLDKNISNLHIVGRACQIRGAQNFFEYFGSYRDVPTGIKIGLFCSGALDKVKIMKKISYFHNDNTRLKYQYDGLHVVCGDKSTIIPYQELQKYIRSSCKKCSDYTAESSDISVGADPDDPSKNIVIARTPAGEDLINHAKDNNYINLIPLPDNVFQKIDKYSQSNKEQARWVQ